jgi:hypothetical protein
MAEVSVNTLLSKAEAAVEVAETEAQLASSLNSVDYWIAS